MTALIAAFVVPVVILLSYQVNKAVKEASFGQHVKLGLALYAKHDYERAVGEEVSQEALRIHPETGITQKSG